VHAAGHRPWRSARPSRQGGRLGRLRGAGAPGTAATPQRTRRRRGAGRRGGWARASACRRATTSGRLARQCRVHVSTAAVVSCPAISMVIRSSRSCLLDICTPAGACQPTCARASAPPACASACMMSVLNSTRRLASQGRAAGRRLGRAPAQCTREDKRAGQQQHQQSSRGCMSCTGWRAALGARGRGGRRACSPEASRKCRMLGSAALRKSSTNSASSSSTCARGAAARLHSQPSVQARQAARPGGAQQRSTAAPWGTVARRCSHEQHQAGPGGAPGACTWR